MESSMNTEVLSVDDYQIEADAYRRPSRSETEPLFVMLGLAGELGSLLTEIKRKQRDSISFEFYKNAVLEEFGDCLWYFSAICSTLKIRLSDVSDSETFDDLQPQKIFAMSLPSTAFELTLLSLCTKVGDLSRMIAHEQHESTYECLRAFFSLLVKAAEEAGITLSEVAKANIGKIEDRWPKKRSWDGGFDKDYPPYERLPNTLVVDMYERTVKQNTYVIQSIGGVFVGDRLTDNIVEGDDYRFHDVFHYAYAAVLGWSPTTRALLKRKRKSETKIDEGQDAARAVIIEEGIATFIFGQAKKNEFFKHEKTGDVSFALLKQVRQFVEGFEPERCPLWLWEDAILQGCSAFRFLRKHRKGRLTIDRTARVLRVEELTSDPDSVFG